MGSIEETPQVNLKTITKTLNDGTKMPILGLGTWQSKPKEVEEAVYHAICNSGYRHVDAAQIYGNQDEVGNGVNRALKDTGLKREDLWVTSKIWMVDFAPEDVGPAVDRILKDLQLDYVDQILLHWPSVFDKPPKGSSPGNYPERWAGTEDPMFPKDKDGNLLFRDVPLSDTWKALAQEKKAGKVRSIGVSNFSAQEIKDMTQDGAEMPAVNQVEAHVFWNQQELCKEMKELGVAVVAYSPLGNSGFHGEKSGITSDLVGAVSKDSGLTPAQVMLNYLINKDFIVIPKSVTPARIDGNADWVPKLDDKQMAKLDTAPQKRLTDFPFRPGGKFFFSEENLKTMTKKLNDGTEMPILGLGTWQSKPKEVEEAVYHAICKSGYRHIDAAQIYGNQDEVGTGVNRALKDSGLKREDLWVTSKIWMVDFAPEDVGPAVDRILSDLQLDYVDQILLHWPSVFDKPPKGSSPGNYPEKWAGTEDPMFPKDKDGNLLHRDVPLSDTWKALMQEKKAGKVRSIGVSNFSAQEIKDMTQGGAEMPAVNQVEAHVFWNQAKLRKEMQELGVVVVAYSPLGNSGFHGEKSGISSDLVGEVAKESGLTPAQVMLNYLINKDFIVIPKSVTPARIDGNANWELKLNDKQMAKLDTAPQKRLTDFPFRPGGKFFFSEENNLKTMTKKLNDGTEMPILGLGTWQSKPKEVEEAVYHAICKTGYRHIDAAQIYGNQDEVGTGVNRALQDSGLKREDLWVTSKIWMVDFAPEDVSSAVDRILKDLQLDYVDQILLHWPSIFDKPPKGSSPGNYPERWAGTEDPMFPKDKDGNLLHRDVPLSDTWKALMQEKKAGKVRSIGVSNFSAQEIKDMTQGGAEMPAVNQVEAHVFWNQEKLRKEMQELGVAVVAYSPLGNSGFHGEKSGISSDLVGEVSKESGLTPAQVMLNYLINKDFIVIPKSVTPARIDGNANWELKLNTKQMAKLDTAPQKRLTDFPFRPGGKFFFSEENNLKTMTKKLNDGTEMPILGLGTWQSKPKEVEEAVYHAICKTGYRHIDAAQIYGNQDEVGTGVNRALKDSGLKREDLWVTSKIWMVDFAPEDVGPAVDRILKDLQLEYVDQILLHWPSVFDKPPKGSSPGSYPERWAGTEDPMFPKDKDGNLLHRDVPLSDTWKALMQEKKAGKVRSIGVSNFSAQEIKDMTEGGAELPAVNQVEAHVFWNQEKLRKEMQELGVSVVAYSPLGNSGFHGEKSGISSDLVGEVAKESGLTPAQVMLNYLINKDFIVIPKSVTPARIDGNANWELKLNDKQMAKLDSAPQKRLTDFPFRPGGKFFFSEENNLKTITKKLNDGTEMPILGLGTWQSKPKEVEEAVYHAICKTGIRHIDAAQIYGNQDEVGTGVNRALKDTGLKREELWVTSKVWMVDFAPEDVGPAIDRILKELQLDYVDQVLLHWPSCFDKPPKDSSPGKYPEKWAGTEDPMFPKDKDGNLLHRDVPLSETWSAMCAEKKAGKIRSIGVSNFSKAEIEEMTKGGLEMPAVNQVEAHVFWNQAKLRKEMEELGVAVVAYSPLGNSGFHGEKSGISSDLVAEVSKESSLTPAQVMLNYLINKGFIVIPKSVTPARIDGNANWELKLNDEQMAKLDAAPQKRLTDFPFRPGGKFFFDESEK